MKLLGLVPNFSIHVSVSDIYIPMIGPSILLYTVLQCLLTDRRNIKISYRNMSVDIGNEAAETINLFILVTDLRRL
jgi:hypothetical protein